MGRRAGRRRDARAGRAAGRVGRAGGDGAARRAGVCRAGRGRPGGAPGDGAARGRVQPRARAGLARQDGRRGGADARGLRGRRRGRGWHGAAAPPVFRQKPAPNARGIWSGGPGRAGRGARAASGAPVGVSGGSRRRPRRASARPRLPAHAAVGGDARGRKPPAGRRPRPDPARRRRHRCRRSRARPPLPRPRRRGGAPAAGRSPPPARPLRSGPRRLRGGARPRPRQRARAQRLRAGRHRREAVRRRGGRGACGRRPPLPLSRSALSLRRFDRPARVCRTRRAGVPDRAAPAPGPRAGPPPPRAALPRPSPPPGSRAPPRRHLPRASRPGRSAQRRREPRPVMIGVVSGLPRAGTSLVMQMLEAGGLPPLTDTPGTPAHRAPDASNPRGYYELGAVRRLHRSGAPWLAAAEGRAVKVVAPLLPLLPDGPAYRVVLVLRDLGEVLASQAVMLNRLGRPAGDPHVLRRAFEQQLVAARALLERESRFAPLVLEHADLLRHPAASAATLAAFFQEASVRFDCEAMAAAVDPKLYRTRLARDP